jgi:hypothetical protein
MPPLSVVIIAQGFWDQHPFPVIAVPGNCAGGFWAALGTALVYRKAGREGKPGYNPYFVKFCANTKVG